MRFLICFLLSLALLSFVDAGCYKEGRRPDAIKKKLTEKELYSAATAKPSPIKSFDELPRNHDWCNVDGKSYCSVSWNQHIPQYCGACWVHGALGQANDRIKIQLNGLHDNNLARQVILNCGKSKGYGEGCNGGEAYDIFEYMHRYGLPDETCQNYVAKESEQCDDAAICHNCMPIGEEIFPYRCWAVKPPIMYRVKEYGTVKGEAAMMSEILARGPITCGFVTTDEFDYNYRGGVYIDRSNSTDVNHDVEVVGWGEENGVKYWKARNSWGTYWGENGFFRILRGENNALFEDECVFAIFDTHEVEDVLDGTKKGSMYGIYSPDNLHKLPTPVQIEKYGNNDARVYDHVKQSSGDHHQGQEKEAESTTLLDTAKLSEAGVDALSYAVKGGEKIGAQATNQAQNAEKYIKAGEENAAKFASQYKDMAKGFASSGKDYAKMAEKYASMQGNSGKGHGKGGSNTPDYMKWAGSYQQGGGYSNYQGGQGGKGDSMKTGAKANVDEIKAAGKLSKQFIPNGNNYYKSPSTSSFADKQELSAAIVNAFVEKKDHDDDNNAEEANAKETEEAIRHAIEEAFADEKADKKQTAEKIKTAIIAALNDIKVHVKEHGNTIKESASTAAKEEADEAKQVANDIANRVKSLGKEISDDIHQAAEKSKENEAAHQDAIQQEKPQSFIDSAAVADGVSPSSSSSFPTVLGLCVTGVVVGGLYYGYQKKRENSYQML